MGAIGRWFRHLVVGMVQGCLVLAISALVLTVAVTVIASHRPPQGVTLTLIIAITVVSGLLGAVAALAWRLSHIEEMVHVARDLSEHVSHSQK